MERFRTLVRIGPVDTLRDSLYEFRRLGPVPAWAQVVAVVVCFLTMVYLTNAEYRAAGSVLGFAGSGTNALINPIYEELIFRGWILGHLVRRCSNFASILISSLLFGLMHLRNVYWLDTGELLHMVAYTGLIFGPIAGYVTLRFRSVWPAVLLHYANNLGYYLR
ncbi:MAG: lysostaphin resistance A-like protein [Planctomycetota bacterium]